MRQPVPMSYPLVDAGDADFRKPPLRHLFGHDVGLKGSEGGADVRGGRAGHEEFRERRNQVGHDKAKRVGCDVEPSMGGLHRPGLIQLQISDSLRNPHTGSSPSVRLVGVGGLLVVVVVGAVVVAAGEAAVVL